MSDQSESVESELEALTQFIYMAPIGLAQIAIDGEFSMVNPECAQLLMPLSPRGAMTNLFVALEGVLPDLRHRVEAYASLNGMVCDGLRFPVRWTAGQRTEARLLSLSLLKLDAHRLMAVLSDVTEAERRERELRESQAWFHAIVSGINGYALATLDSDGAIVDWNESIARLTGFDQKLVGKPFATFFPSDSLTPESQADRLRDADAAGWSIDESWMQRADGSRFWGSSLVSPLRSSADQGSQLQSCCGQSPTRTYSLIIRDTSEQRESHEALRRALSCDHLTGLANRRAFFEAGERECRRWQGRPRALSLIIFDADHFKAINDSYGHPAGDAVLRHLAEALQALFRTIDVVARLGGEEFVVLLPAADVDEALLAAQRLCARVAAQAVGTEEGAIRYTVSAGVATMDSEVHDLDGLIKRADQALYRAKANGRNRAEAWLPSPAESVVRAPAKVPLS